ncbi:Chemotaxis protein methyltransferase CheR [Cystobacter fuscus DSM 2262]|uniref:histidine kinase n=1 Tax=Cystobacter fuscus (strain ATCC 25194 / DSM 2262 / NBRC 100088 / M29) TaxID=1242864 RepID=S9P6R3_CYSF2|nr:response regulator [Cystobacter fuscus]EPX57922.1 Chemotaxis protein methyltransferase CheR [Cystobacter fuscus DSM 2262]
MPHREPILLNINDNEANRYAVTRILRASGFQVAEGGTGSEALHLAAELRPDLIILDVKLPDINGIEVCRRLKSDPHTSNIVVMHLSANYIRTENKVEGLESGADGYLTQPVDTAELLATVRSLLRLRRAEEDARSAAVQWKTTFDSLGDGVCLLDGRGRVMRANRSFESLFGGSEAAVLGQSFAALMREAASGEALPASCGEALDCREEATVCLGSRWYRVAANPVEGDAGQVTGAVRILTDITPHRQLQEELRQRAAELAEADRRKDEFLAMLAHELRNPLSAIVNSLHLAEATQPQGAESRAMRVLARQSQHMARMVDDLLDVSRFNRGHIELRRALVDLRQVVQHGVEARRQSLLDKGLHLELTLPAEALWLEGDATRLEQVVSNLLDNARKYTPVGGHVFVGVTVEQQAQERQVVLRVKDTGIGMSAELQSRVFELFVQGEQQLDRSRGGLGIGLTLVRRLVELHGGRVRAYSEGEGKGSELMVTLPLAAQVVASLPVETRIAPPETSAARRVLLVEDNEDTREVLRELLEMWGHEVAVAEDGFRGVERFPALRPHVALVDLGLPGMDGFQVARRIRESEGGQDVYLVALTGYSGEHRSRAVEAGFDLHVVKPVKPDELERLLNQLPARKSRA